MTSETPPTYYFSNITFNPDFYQSTSGEYLTKTTGKQYFLSYPYAQGSESITQIFTSNVDSLTPTTEFNLLASQTSGDIKMGAGLLGGDVEIANGTNYGGNVLIANSASAGNVNTIKLGNSYTTTTIGGPVSSNGLLSSTGISNTGSISSSIGITTPKLDSTTDALL
jgi:hypothetical protein